MSIINGSAMQGATRGFYPKTIEGSLRFNDDDSAYLSATHADGGEATYTLSLWAKRSTLGISDAHIFGSIGNSGDDYELIRFNSSDQINWQLRDNTLQGNVTTNAVFRDTSAWYHLVFYRSGSTVKIYVNGVEQSITTGTAFSATTQWANNNAYEVRFGVRTDNASGKYDGYLAEVFFIDGTAHNADAFGETKNGVWVPKDITATDFTMGTNGFHLTFQDDTEVEAFNTTLHRGNGGTQSITGMGFAPDFVWIKNRDNADNHYLFDAVRGAFNGLNSDTTSAEVNSSNDLSSFDSDGFSIGSDGGMNRSGQAYVAWGWKAGGAPTVDNSAGAGNVPTAGSVKIDGVNSTSALAGTIPATRLSASTTYGFSVVSYTANNTNNSTIAHGLGAVPDFVLVTARNFPTATNWAVWHSSLASIQHYLRLNTTDAVVTTDNSNFGTVDPTSTVMNLGYAGSTNSGTYNYIMYCWAEKTGYSKFGSYSGSRTAGQTVTCGFRPAFLLVKNINQSGSQGNWMIVDGTRETTNSRGTNILYPNASSSESTIGSDDLFDFTDTGFDVLNTGDGTAITAQMNGQGDTIIYAAFADTREAAFWLDQSGNDNDWQPVNLDHNDTLLDSPTDNFCTWNPLIPSTGTFADGNLSVTTTVDEATSGTTLPSAGKHYCEIICTSATTIANARLGVTNADGIGTPLGANTNTWAYLADGRVYHNSSASSYGTTLAVGDVFQIALDIDAGKVWYGINGTFMASGDPTAGTNPSQTFTANQQMTFAVASGSGTFTFVANFGQQPFKYDPPA